MESSNRGKWIPITVLVGIIYLVVGVVFAALAAAASSHQGVVTWRLAAWVVSGVAFVAQIAYEQSRLGSASRTSAFHAALAAALGAFALAANALIHRHGVAGPAGYAAFLVWPVLVFIPAFVAAFAVGAVLSRALPRR
jgi:phosphoglycerol transferase MdoB-like AlkP superfamily enzyme